MLNNLELYAYYLAAFAALAFNFRFTDRKNMSTLDKAARPAAAMGLLLCAKYISVASPLFGEVGALNFGNVWDHIFVFLIGCMFLSLAYASMKSVSVLDAPHSTGDGLSKPNL